MEHFGAQCRTSAAQGSPGGNPTSYKLINWFAKKAPPNRGTNKPCLGLQQQALQALALPPSTGMVATIRQPGKGHFHMYAY